MGLLAAIDAELQKDLMDFIKAQEEKPYPHTLGEALIKELLKDILKGNARMSGCAKNDAKKTMYIELTFWENKQAEEGEKE